MYIKYGAPLTLSIFEHTFLNIVVHGHVGIEI